MPNPMPPIEPVSQKIIQPVKKSAPKVEVKVKTSIATSVRISLLFMTITATLGAGLLLGSLAVASLPKSVLAKKTTPTVKTVIGNEERTLLVKFKNGTTQVQREKAVKNALKKQVSCLTQKTTMKWTSTGRVKVTKNALISCKTSLKSLSSVITPISELPFANSVRREREDVATVAQATASLSTWYALRVTGATIDLNSVAAVLKKESVIEVAEANPKMSGAAISLPNANTEVSKAVSLPGAWENVYGVLGDANMDGTLSLTDVDYVMQYVFSGGPAPKNMSLADVNHDGMVTVSDAVLMIQMVLAALPTPNDLTGDAKITIDDASVILQYVFNNGAAPDPLSKADVDGNGSVNVSDAVALILYVQAHGSATPTCTRGDANGDGAVTIDDVYFINDYIFAGGRAPQPLTCADVDQDSSVTISDVVVLIRLLKDGPSDTVVSLSGYSPYLAASNPTPKDSDPVIPQFFVGDVNNDNRVNFKDPIALVEYAIHGTAYSDPLARGDMDFSGSVNISDAVVLIALVGSADEGRAAQADLNADGVITHADTQIIIDYIFAGGTAPNMTLADVNNDGLVTISDAVALTNYITSLLSENPVGLLVEVQPEEYLRGDADASGNITLDDAKFLIAYIFAGGPAPSPLDRGDANKDGKVTISDVVTIVNHLNAIEENPTVQTALRGDANKDGSIDLEDEANLVAAIKNKSQAIENDVNGDGRVDMIDAYALPVLLDSDNASQPLVDLNGDGKLTILDAKFLLDYIFNGGAAPANMSAADVNGDGLVSISDVVALLNQLQSLGIPTYIVGDANSDLIVNVQDVEFMMEYIFHGGKAPDPLIRADLDGNGAVTVTDIVLLINRLYPVTPTGAPGTTINVAVLDSGIKNMTSWNAVTVGKLTKGDDNGHGTNVAAQITKTAPKNIRIIPVKILDKSAVGTCLTAVRGMQYAVDAGADVINISASGRGVCQLFSDAVAYAESKGVVVVVAAGNDNVAQASTVQGRSGALIVGAATSAKKESYSNTAQVYAPGNDMRNAVCGTSCASATVSAGSALLLLQDPTTDVNQIADTLQKTGIKGTALRVNLEKATEK